ncbi:MAG: ABC transporter ATP-binding protein [Alphaproteobacteria bacterium]|nr:ABC transporter ATP-binding protein [Alphaproteobacteria bacterium]
MEQVKAKHVLKFVYDLAKSFPLGIVTMLFVAVLWAVDLSLRPYLLKIILDRVSDTPAVSIFSALLIPAGFYFFMSFFVSTSYRVYGYFVDIKMIPELRQRISQRVFGKLIDQSHSFYQNNFSGGLANKLNDLNYSVPEIVISMETFLSHFLAVSIAIFALWQVSPVFAWAMFFWSFAFVLVSLVFSSHLNRFADEWSEKGSRFTGRVVDVLSNILSVRLFSRHAQERDIMDGAIQETLKAEQKMEWAFFWIFLIYGYSFVLYIGLTLYFLIQGRQDGIISVGDFALVLGINVAIVDFLWQLTKDFSHFSQMMGKASQALRTLLMPVEIQDVADAKELVLTQGKIAFKNVKFHYKGTVPLFNNKNIEILPGQKVGLVGYSGSGKTTFVNLILRIYDVSSGHILIDDQDIQQVTQKSLRENIAMIPQDPSLFNRSILENIRYGFLSATDEDVMEAAKKAHAHDFIMSLPEGYETHVGERGVKLSGGQRQRISIARALLKNAPILMLDEATSQLDTITERLIQDSLWTLMQGKTALVIAHRLSTLLHMDRILVFDKGRIIEDGSHADLLQKSGLYKTLWDAQVGGFLPDSK